jgi:hypothetical protein
MKNVFRSLCLVIFLVGIITFSLGWEKRKSDTEPSQSYVVVYFESHTTPDGKMAISNWRTTYVKANGEFTTVFQGSDASAAFSNDATGLPGTSSPVYAKTSEGTFTKETDSSERKSMSMAAPESIEPLYHSHSFLKNSKNFARMDKVAGLDVYVLKTVSEENSNYWTETSVSPLTGSMPLRAVIHQPDGNIYTIEAVKVEFKGVPDNLNDDIQSLPSTGKFGEKQATTPKNPN